MGTLRACRNDLLKSHESLNQVGSQGGLPWELEEAWRRVTCEPGPVVASGSSTEPGQEDGARTGGQKGACTQKLKHEDRRVAGGG